MFKRCAYRPAYIPESVWNEILPSDKEDVSLTRPHPSLIYPEGICPEAPIYDDDDFTYTEYKELCRAYGYLA